MGILVIYDEEEEYAHGLMEYISEKKGMPFKVLAFSRAEEFYRYVENKYIDLLLISESVISDDISQMNIGKIVMISEGNECLEYKEFPHIYKYQSADMILREAINQYTDVNKEKGGVPIINKSDTQIIGVYSPVGRSGKTSFALTLGHILTGDGTVLYINMEEFSGFTGIFSKAYKSDLSDLMYYYRQAPSSISLRLKAIVNNFHGMDYIPPMKYSGDIRNIKSDYWVKMILDIAEAGMYDNIILDLSNMLSDVFDVLSVCNLIYMPLNNDRISLCKVNEYEEFIFRTEREEIINKTIKIKLPDSNANEWNENYIEQLIWGEMGDFIRKILKEEVA